MTTGQGKTEQLLHEINHKLGTHKGARRVWLEGKRLTDAGFRQGVRYQMAPTDGGLVLRLSPAGDKRVSGTTARPVVDILNQTVTDALGPAETVHVRFTPRAIEISLLSPAARAAALRLRRVNHRLRGGQAWRLGSVSHGAGIASSGILAGLGAAEMAFGVDISADYIAQSLQHGPLALGGVSIVSDLRALDPGDLPECDVLEAGLPCVAASRAGRAKKGLERPEDDPQVEDLEVAFIEILRATQPAVVVLENVPEYATSDSAGRIRRWLERWGYTTSEQVLHGAEWSLEARDRWVLVAVTDGLTVDLNLTPAARPAALGEILDRKVPATAWRSTASFEAKKAKDEAAGNGFSRGRRFLTAADTSTPTLRRGYQKGGNCDPRLSHPTRPGVARLFSAAEHARIKGVPPTMVDGLSEKVAHEVLGQSVIRPAFLALGAAIAAAL